MAQAQTTNVGVRRRGRWPLFLVGVVLFLAGPVVYSQRFNAGDLRMPWYLPILSTVGVALMALSVYQRRGIIRIAALVFFVLVCALEWFFMLVATRTPAYAGPAQPGHDIPVFATTLADGKPFTSGDLHNGKRTVLVFNRGRW